MRSIPVDVIALGDLLALGVDAATDDEGKQRANRDGVALWKVEALLRPTARGDFKPKAEVVQISIASNVKPEVEAMQEITPSGLIARPWQMNGNSGISLSAEAIA